MTTFVGNLADPIVSQQPSLPRGEFLALLGVGTAHAQDGVTQVCVEHTSFCTTVDPGGFFTLDADVGGDVVLVFRAPDFTARLPLSNVPPGATVQIRNIHCNTTTGACRADDVQIEAPEEDQPPICDAAEAVPSVVWPPNHELVPIAIDGVVDPDGDPVFLTVSSVIQDEPVQESGTGSGNTAPDASLQPLAVRAERDGSGNGRVYTIAFTADDARGGACVGTVRVCVPHDQGRGTVCADDGARFNSLNP